MSIGAHIVMAGKNSNITQKTIRLTPVNSKTSAGSHTVPTFTPKKIGDTPSIQISSSCQKTEEGISARLILT